VFVGDGANDTTWSAQRADELRLRVGDLDAQRVATRAQMARLEAEIAAEAARFRDRSDVAAALPSSGRIWEMLVAPGEHVAKGEELMRVLDCANPTVSANVDENVYDKLELGGAATFKPALGGGKIYSGRIVNLTGEASAPGNFAIPPMIMRTSSFYATIAVPDMGETGCAVGRTGTVTFAPAGAGAISELRP
jgi:multidrug resistance efflux pump